jgi:hypothetical protein
MLTLNEKSQIINLCIIFLKTNFRNRVSFDDNLYKCERDLLMILEAIINDLEEKTLHYTTEIADAFWKDGKLLLKNTEAEFATYDYMSTIISKNLDDDSKNHVLKSVENIKKVLSNGSELDPTENLVVAAKNTNYCQRNWDYNKPIPERDINSLFYIARNMPSKQNRKYYEVFVSTNKEFNDWLYLEGSVDYNDTESYKLSYQRNSQTSAPLVFIFFEYFISYEKYIAQTKFDDHHETAMTCIGISAGATALAANHMGYRTGFCQCLAGQRISKKIIDLTGIEQFGAPRLALGIGHSNKDHDWNVIVDDKNNALKTIPSIPKQYNSPCFRIR